MKDKQALLRRTWPSHVLNFCKIAIFCTGVFLLSVVSVSPMSALAREPTALHITVAYQEVKAFARVQLSLREVIAIVEQLSSDAKVVDISFDGLSDQLVYRIQVYEHDEILGRSIDALTGTTVGDESATSILMLDIDRSELVRLKQFGMDLNQAAAIAEGAGSGKAISAGLERVDGRLVFKVIVLADELLKLITVDPEKRQIQIEIQ
jgi:uncharacterized membrane protein YkoI